MSGTGSAFGSKSSSSSAGTGVVTPTGIHHTGTAVFAPTITPGSPLNVSGGAFGSGTGSRKPFPITASPTGNQLNFTSPVQNNASVSQNGTITSVFSSCASVYDQYYHSLQNAFVNKLPFNQTYTRPAVCSSVLDSHCEVWVGEVDLLYWPTPYASAGLANATTPRAQQAQATAPVILDGSSLVPESAYIVYRDARAILPYNTVKTTTGPSITRMTVPYPAKNLYTYYDCKSSVAPMEVWPSEQIDFRDFNVPPRWDAVSKQRPCHLWSIEGDTLQHQTFPRSEIATQYTDYVNQPLVLLPGDLMSLHPEWASCKMGNTGIGLLDPPRAIVPGGGMVDPASVTAASKVTAAPDLAQPAPTVSSPEPAKTSVVASLSNGDHMVQFAPTTGVPSASSSVAKQPASTAASVADAPIPVTPQQPSVPDSGSVSHQAGGTNNGQQPGQSADQGTMPTTENDSTPGNGSTTGNTSDGDTKSDGQATPAVAGSNTGSSIESASSGSKDTTTKGSDSTAVGSGSSPDSASQGNSQGSKGGGDTVIVTSNSFSPDSPPAPVQSGKSAQIADTPGTPTTPQQAGQGASNPVESQNASAPGSDHVVQAAHGGGVIVNGATLNSASPNTFHSNVETSYGSEGIVLGGNTVAVPQAVAGASAAIPAAIGGHNVQLTADASGTQMIVDGSTLAPGSSHATIGNNVISLMPDGQAYVLPTTLPYVPLAGVSPGPSATVGGSTPLSLPSLPTSQPPTRPQLGIIVGGQTATPIVNAGVALNGLTLSQIGQSATLSNGQVASLATGGLVVGGTQTIPIPQVITPAPGGTKLMDGSVIAPLSGAQTVLSPAASAPASGSKLVIDGNTVTRLGLSGVAIGGTTISNAGQSIRLNDGSVATLESGGIVFGGSSTIGLPPFTSAPTATSSSGVQDGGIGKMIYEGLILTKGEGPATFSDGKIVEFEGSTTSLGTTGKPSSSPVALVSSTLKPGMEGGPIMTTLPPLNTPSPTPTSSNTMGDGILGMGGVYGGSGQRLTPPKDMGLLVAAILVAGTRMIVHI